MALTGERSFGLDYAAAERYCDEWAGDTGEHAAIVEDFSLGGLLLVMDYAAAVKYAASHDAEIQYSADHTAPAPMLAGDCDTPAGLAARYGVVGAQHAAEDTRLMQRITASRAAGYVAHGWVCYLETAHIREATRGE